MDKVNDFFKDLKERISSPFFSSFIISWIPLNWMFLTSLFKYDVKGFTLANYSLYLDYTYSLLNYWNSLIIPFFLALLYSFGYPFLRSCIEIADVWFKTKANDKKIEISKSSKISVEKYMKLREVYESRTKTLEDVLEKESETIEKNETLVNELNLLKQENNEFRSTLTEKTKEINDLTNKIVMLNGSIESYKTRISKYEEKEEIEKNIYKVESLNGEWIFKKISKSRVIKNEEKRVSFNNGQASYFINDKIAIPWFKITSYSFDSTTKNIKIQTDLIEDEELKYFILFPNDDFTILSGNDDMHTLYDVEFTKVN